MMKRTPIKRTGWLRRLKLLAKRSPQRVKDDREYTKFKSRVFRHRSVHGIIFCEACCYRDQSSNIAHDLHHIVPLSAWPAGRMVPSNVLCVCRPCHSWIDDNTKRATELGLLKRRSAS